MYNVTFNRMSKLKCVECVLWHVIKETKEHAFLEVLEVIRFLLKKLCYYTIIEINTGQKILFCWVYGNGLGIL